MRLSEAIRLGAMLKPQAFGELEGDGTTCALGAATEAAGLRITPVIGVDDRSLSTRPNQGRNHFVITVPEDWYTLLGTYVTCPGDCACKLASARTLSQQIPHLNDHHRWTRERIADFVETVESHPKPQAQAPAEVSVAG